jgi:hypothetical protein
VRSSIGGYAKLVQMDDVSASGDVAGICLGSCWESLLVSLSKKVSTVDGNENVAWVAWHGVGHTETGFRV